MSSEQDNYNISCNILFKCFAILYAGRFFQLTIGHIGLPCLCSFIVPCKHGELRFMCIYFRFYNLFFKFILKKPIFE
jgi:hypothetical protein